jgi:hypothetical protein
MRRTRSPLLRGTPGKILGVMAFAVLLAFMGCPTASEDDDYVPVTGIKEVPDTGKAGVELNLNTAVIAPENRTSTAAIEWSIKVAGSTGITRITNNKATPTDVGKLVLTATITDGLAEGEPYIQDFDIVISAADFTAVTKITYTPPDPLYLGAELDLTGVTVEPANATNKNILWTVASAGGTNVSNQDLEDGKATPSVAGKLVLTATIANGKAYGDPYGLPYTENFEVSVIQHVPVTGITAPVQWIVGKPFDLSTVKVEPENATFQEIGWAVADEGGTGVSTITEGTFTPSAEGDLVLTGTVAKGTTPGTGEIGRASCRERV